MGKTIIVSSHILPELADVCNKVGIIDAGKMIASNDVATIIKQVQPNTVVLIHPIQANQLDAAAKVLQEQNIVEAVQIANGLIRVTLSPDVVDYSALAGDLIERGILFSKFAAEEINLESAFMAFTKGAGSKI
jgi:ABC-2 type transport system ATP-binding protein